MRCSLCGYEFDQRDARCTPACPMFEECEFICCPNCGYLEVDPAHAKSVQFLQKLLRRNEKRTEKQTDARVG